MVTFYTFRKQFEEKKKNVTISKNAQTFDIKRKKRKSDDVEKHKRNEIGRGTN